MSTRTIIEINHDHLHDLDLGGGSREVLHQLIRKLGGSLTDHDRVLFKAHGIRILGQRHHSEPEWKQSK